MRRVGTIGLLAAASMAGLAVRRIEESPTGDPADSLSEPGVPGCRPILTPEPLPPSRMTRQQRRRLARKGWS